jgi:lia operon protein LiaG
MPWTPIPSCLVMFLLPALSHAQQPERYTLAEGDAAVYNLAGNLRVEPGNGAITVEMTRTGADAARLRVAQGGIDGRSTLRVIYPSDMIHYAAGGEKSSTQLRVREDGTFGDFDDDDDPHERHRRHAGEDGRRVTISSEGPGLAAGADLLVRVPRGQRVAVFLAVGAVTVGNVDGDLRVDASSAPVTATGTRGALSIEVGSGSVRVSEATGELNVDTGSGSVDLSRLRGGPLSIETGSGDVTATDLESTALTVETGSGDIRLTGVAAPELSIEAGSGGITAELRRDVTSLEVQTGSGDIAIRAPASLGAIVEIETSSGAIDTDFPLQVTRRGRDHVSGSIGDGKGTIEIETGSGEVSLLKAQS